MESQINFQTHLLGSKNTLALLGIFIFKIFEKNYVAYTAKIILGKISLPKYQMLTTLYVLIANKLNITVIDWFWCECLATVLGKTFSISMLWCYLIK